MNAAAATHEPLPTTYRRQTSSIWQAAWQATASAIWQALHGAGQRRAARELHELALRWDDIDPAVAQQLRDAANYDTRTDTLSTKETS